MREIFESQNLKKKSITSVNKSKGTALQLLSFRKFSQTKSWFTFSVSTVNNFNYLLI